MKKPNKATLQKSVSISFPPDVLELIDRAAEMERRSRSQLIVMKLEQILQEDPAAYGVQPDKSPARKPRLEDQSGAA